MTDFDAQPGRKAPAQSEPSLTQREADEAELYAGLRGVSGIVAGAQGVIELLRDVAEFAAQAVPGGVGVALIDPRYGISSVKTWAATAVLVHEIDTVQYDELHEGPCITCMQSRRPAVSGSLGSDSRWPHFGGRVARMRVHSALAALPLIVGDQVIGAINAYAKNRDTFGEHAVRLGSQFAKPAAVSVHNAQLLANAQERTTRLQRALDSRAVIDQAIGIIRSRSGSTAEEAFGRLAHISQTENMKLNVAAERLVEEAVRRARAWHR
ncbi:GAF and ANTAR domain-containing protein [Mycobacterium avium]|uniref:GAF and ANTAR domain-containing protein n=1 Tax=Mycobacterium avium TaxID=1764 RepID=UPI000A001040|nr:GAF and ANTAR domain-containing protein [Mycobacterium avium]MBZ4536934.1 GAF and ANTAR domain-containing protein [Mycobacterium avium subsp. hominissuis]MBZ4552082.1 GAF and ANTAR domain-containing protein [Mycobacterium avium subsp. hominissuis]MBZ4580351.1 GAF and ANTAR domain-containing protein [Mycobacterium avium subsp. hominissuis]MBZ4594241.1 GAF and ANTAR domain-containing protein [Mycobacterium avium subsp. hominissuis]MBZ4608237.1 GAF and ANTAR domain-containing protein [Mycobact